MKSPESSGNLRGKIIAERAGLLRQSRPRFCAQFGSMYDTGKWAYNAQDVMNRLNDTAKSSVFSFGLLNLPADVVAMQQQLADMQFQKRKDELAAVYEKNVEAVENDLLLDKEIDEQTQTQLSEMTENEETKEIDDDLDFESFSAQLIGISTSTGVQTEEVTLHAFERLKSRGVPASSIVEALTAPLEVGTIKENRSQVFVGEHATTVINVDTGKIITVWPTHAKKAKKLKGGE